MKHLIAFVGFKSCGKNTAAQVLIDQYQFQPFSFADAIKDALAAIFCWPRDLLEGVTTESRQWRETVDPWWAKQLAIPHFTPRFAMIYFGSDVMRAHFHPDIWTLNIERRISLLPDDQSVVLTDVRFPNEFRLIEKYHGRIARIQRGLDPYWTVLAAKANQGDELCRRNMQSVDIHYSEWAWIGCAVETTIHNDADIATLQNATRDWFTTGP